MVTQLGKNLRHLLARRRISQPHLAGAMGISQVMVSRWVNSKNVPDAYQLLAICGELKVPAEWLLEKDMETISDEELHRYRTVQDIVGVIGLEEAHRRLLAPPMRESEREAEALAEDAVGSARGRHTVAKPVTLDKLSEEVSGPANGRAKGKKP